MRILNETLTAPGPGQPIAQGLASKLMITPTAFTGTSFSLGVEFYTFLDYINDQGVGAVQDTWVPFHVTPATQVGKWIDLGDFAGNLPHQSQIRVVLTGEDIESLSYRVITDTIDYVYDV